MVREIRDDIEQRVRQLAADLVKNLADLDRLYETVKQQKGRIDVLFANAIKRT